MILKEGKSGRELAACRQISFVHIAKACSCNMHMYMHMGKLHCD